MRPFTDFEITLRERFGEVLYAGAHPPNGQACLLEAAHIAIGEAWSDRPDHWPDLRPLNDAPWSSDAVRTQQLVPVLHAYWDWQDWTTAKQTAVMQCVAILTVQYLIGELTVLPQEIRAACKAATTIGAAWNAARSAESAARSAARIAAWSAAENAAWNAARSAESDRYLIAACSLWIQAAREQT